MAVRTSTSARTATELLAGLPPPPQIEAAAVAAAAVGGRRLVVLDDDPTGTQTVVGIPIVTAWAEQDLRWALGEHEAGFYVLTNTRSLAPADAAARNQEVIRALAPVAAELGIDVALVSRSDSTLRGHFPLETDTLVAAQERWLGRRVDGVVIVPAYIDAGRITVDSLHYVRTAEGFVPVAKTEFADDPSFGFRSSDLREYVAEKTEGRWPAHEVTRITLGDIRRGGVEAVARLLRSLSDGRPAVVDAACDEDLRVVALAAIEAERDGRSFIYRVGPSFVRNRLGQGAQAPLGDHLLAEILAPRDASNGTRLAGGGLVVAGSFVGLTTRQLEGLLAGDPAARFILDVPALLAGAEPAAVAMLADGIVAALRHGDVVLHTSRELIREGDGERSMAVSAQVSDGLVAVVRAVLAQITPRWIVAKGGITASDLATRAVGIRRAVVRGTLLPGIVSLWEPVGAVAAAVPYVVFAGNVGDAQSLATVVERLKGACQCF